jgi:isopentenyl diphosphate isomerase/L-lactate dehydrogenase-like FMN-dependent dehydrogenase
MDQLEFSRELDARVAKYDLLCHPFYKAWSAGELTRDDLRAYALDYYQHVNAFPSYLAALALRLNDGELRRAVLANMRDEQGGEGEAAEAHSDLWMDFAEGMGAARNAFGHESVPEVKQLVKHFARVAEKGTPAEALAAFERRKLRPRVLVDVQSVSTATTVLGTEIALPILLAPLAMQRMAHLNGELATARAAAAARTIMCLSTATTTRPEEVAAATQGAPQWFQVYVFGDRSQTEELIAEAVENDFSALVLTVDTPYLGRRERDIRIDFKIPEHLTVVGDIFSAKFDAGLGWRDLEWLAGYGLPVIVKGILTAEDAKLACEHGAAAVVVSNHGGRQLDGVQASLDALEEVVTAVDGRAEVLLDGGVRRGTDVLKALALGAQAVLIGRAMLWGLAVDGEQGVTRVLELLRKEVELGLALLGCASPADVTRAHAT